MIDDGVCGGGGRVERRMAGGGEGEVEERERVG